MINPVDECNTVISIPRIIKAIKAAGAGFVGLIGVQSNQFPRALDLARELRAAGIPVVIGGFHVSGCIAMLPELPADLREALDLGITLYAGEGEGRMSELLLDIRAGTAKPLTVNDVFRNPLIKLKHGLRYIFTRKGYLAICSSTAQTNVRSDGSADQADLVLRLMPVSGKDRYARTKAYGLDPWSGFSIGIQ